MVGSLWQKQATAESDGLELGITGGGARLRVTLTNRAAQALRVYFAAQGPNARHHDFLTAVLRQDGVADRVLRFTGNRNSSRLGLVELKPGERVSDQLDLSAWAVDKINGGRPIAPGTYGLVATYRVAQTYAWSGTLTAGPILAAFD